MLVRDVGGGVELSFFSEGLFHGGDIACVF